MCPQRAAVPEFDRENERDDVCGCENRHGEPCGGTPMENGRCYSHGGASTGPENPNTETNALDHGVTADPAGLFDALGDDAREWVDGYTDAWMSRAGLDETDPTRPLLRLAAVRAYQAMVGEREVIQAGNEHEKVVGVSDDGRPITDTTEHYLARWADRHMKAATRMLKDVSKLPGGDEDGRVDEAIVARFEAISERRED